MHKFCNKVSKYVDQNQQNKLSNFIEQRVPLYIGITRPFIP